MTSESVTVKASDCKYCGGSGRHQGHYVFAGPWPDCEFCGGTGKAPASAPESDDESLDGYLGAPREKLRELYQAGKKMLAVPAVQPTDDREKADAIVDAFAEFYNNPQALGPGWEGLRLSIAAALSAERRAGMEAAAKIADAACQRRMFEAGYSKGADGKWLSGARSRAPNQSVEEWTLEHNRLIHKSDEALAIAAAIRSSLKEGASG